MTALVFVLVVLAAYRATRFVVDDSLIEGARHRWFLRFPPDEYYRRWSREGTTAGPESVVTTTWVLHADPVRPVHKLGQLMDCAYCTGWWASGVVLACFAAFGLVDWRWRSVAFWPAVAGGQGLLNALDTKLND